MATGPAIVKEEFESDDSRNLCFLSDRQPLLGADRSCGQQPPLHQDLPAKRQRVPSRKFGPDFINPPYLTPGGNGKNSYGLSEPSHETPLCPGDQLDRIIGLEVAKMFYVPVYRKKREPRYWKGRVISTGKDPKFPVEVRFEPNPDGTEDIEEWDLDAFRKGRNTLRVEYPVEWEQSVKSNRPSGAASDSDTSNGQRRQPRRRGGL